MNTKLKKATMDGNTAAAYASYAFTEVATIYPITPSSQMAELVDEWSANGVKNIFGETVEVRELQAEGGAAGALHGALQGGALCSTYTASQGLMLMLPNMYKIAGELLPGVFHVSSRAVASNALSIFGDHQDAMSCRQTGFALLASGSVQEAFHMACVSHLAAIKSRIPFLHFFDGFRTSHEYQKIDILEYDELKKLVDFDSVKAFRENALNPDHPAIRGTAQNPDIYFQTRESVNKFYDAIPGIVEKYMNDMNKLCGTDYKLFNYYGAEDAEDVIITMGSSTGVVEETIDYMNANGEKFGLLKVHLYRPFSADYFLKELPETVKRICVLDRTKEPGSMGEPLYLDVRNVYADMNNAPLVIGGRYGLGSKDFTPADVMAVYENLRSGNPKNYFTVSIIDDVTGLSLPKYEAKFSSTPKDNFSFKFWGLGADGTVGANKSAVKIIGNHTDYNAQAYFAYDSKKSGGVTISHLRMGPKPIKGSYLISSADFIACHNQSYVDKYDLIGDLKEGGTFLLNTIWSPEELKEKLPGSLKRKIVEKKAKFYTLNAVDIAREIGLGGRINMIMQAGFFKLSSVLPIDEAVKYLKEEVKKSYGNKGQHIVDMNNSAIDKGIQMIKEIEIPASWADAELEVVETPEDMPDFVKNVMKKIARQEGNELPVSTFNGREDGSFPDSITKWEKRGIAIEVPKWNMDKCIQCNQCSYVCSHAVVRPTLVDDLEAKNAPACYEIAKAKGYEGMQYHLAISGMDCTGCGVCVKACPVDALEMVSLDSVKEELNTNWEYTEKKVTSKDISDKQKYTVKGSQFLKPYVEFSGACAGCGETPYIKLITQLYGDRMMIANSAGCTHIWGGSPEVPYTTNSKGHGPSWGCSLFEDTAEYGYGMFLGNSAVRKLVRSKAKEAVTELPAGELKDALNDWEINFDLSEGTRERSEKLIQVLQSNTDVKSEAVKEITKRTDYLVKPSQWIVGGDGWAYDIGYGGLDHVLASGENVNVIVVDTEVYSNTGGQSSKATPTAAVAQFAASGKKTKKKDLGMMAMSYGYVAQIAMGADKNQTMKAIKEAEAYDGPSLIIAYATCINHGVKGGMSNSQNRQADAVKCGYWHLYRFNPDLKDAGQNPFTLDSKAPSESFKGFLMNEVRYTSLVNKFPETAEELFAKAENDAIERYEAYDELANRKFKATEVKSIS
ncbi:pyruvate-ferredoxin/flavodoxin oxidoreductase [Dethiosulfatibacter aminovorans DSM 17477]|uniref:Pyruvate-ferredoxin/flavodoxin oxidoreductase n=1 Tax=Dethiosulfatibacter aminovorans DSM 17477 TaxID=1121476 RepID=A0A1M6C4N9_9FIRM|nr:pyruvate:ferredoxin (flavodoxin) oxidoreductase [Dethiosulfatibacter aminovorans]SHI55913.1 pyruvate-ferredoxin/flavodoxin oxidoreductase [Dethiosulfatibacter aminovorans DSM 17477]